MITTTHAILNITLLGRKDKPERNWPLILGAIFPDLSMFTFFVSMAFLHSLGTTHQKAYPFFQAWTDWAHSIPLAVAGILICLAVKYQRGLYFFASMALHDLEDLPVHAEVVHRHFLPFSNYRFHSPFSYWEPHHHAEIVAPLEWIMVLICIGILWRRGLTSWAQVALLFVGVFQGLLLLYTVWGVHW